MREVMDGAHINDKAEGSVWYLGYGSNMKSSVMSSQKIQPLESCPVKVPDHVLTFDVFGLPYSEPAMASISRYSVDEFYSQKSVPCVHGVAYRLSASDLRRLITTEGGGVAYQSVELVAVRMNGDGAVLKLQTLVARYPRRPNAAPSLRYKVRASTLTSFSCGRNGGASSLTSKKTLLIEGAEEHDLPIEYQKYLLSLPAFIPGTSWYNRLGAFTYLWVGRRMVGVMARWVKRALDVHEHCPRWYGSVIWLVYTVMWLWHDCMHAPIFGRGDGGGVSYEGVHLV
jgi:hypothetical protein